MWFSQSRKILLSYRHADTGPTAGRLADLLKRQFGEDNVFIDVDNIPFGVDFRSHIRSMIKSCDVILVLIGSMWAGGGAGQSRLLDPEDHLRIEVETAFELGRRVIPVIVDKAQIPRSDELPEKIKNLPFLNAAPLDTGRDFNIHAARIIESISNDLKGETLRRHIWGKARSHVAFCFLQCAVSFAVSFLIAATLTYLKYNDVNNHLESDLIIFSMLSAFVVVDPSISLILRPNFNFVSELALVIPVYLFFILFCYLVAYISNDHIFDTEEFFGLIVIKCLALLVLGLIKIIRNAANNYLERRVI